MHSSRICSAVFLFCALVLFTVAFPSSTSAQTYFFNRADSATGNNPADVAIADFNGDGRQDLAIINWSDSTISILLGQQNGNFGAKTDYAVGKDLAALIAADFNHDGKVDLAVVDSVDGCVWVLLGNGDGTFATPVQYATAYAPNNLVTGDFNHDGNLDLAVVDSNCSVQPCIPGFVSILLGSGDGTFRPKVDYAVGTEPFGIVAQDFNGDGKLDLAITNNSSNTVSVLSGNGDGTFQTHEDGTSDLVLGAGLGSIFMSSPMAILSPGELNFGNVGLGSTSTVQNLTVTSAGNSPLNLTSASATTGYAVNNACGSSVPSGASCLLGLTFTPQAVGVSTGVLTLMDNSATTQQNISLSGIGRADFSLSIASGSLSSATVAAGGNATYAISVSPLGGFTQTVSLDCTGAPATTTCSVSPSSVTLDGNNPSTASVKVSTTARSTATNLLNGGKPRHSPLFPTFAALVFLPLVFLRNTGSRRKRSASFLLCLCLCVCLPMISCGGGGSSSSSSGSTGGTSGTPAGTYVLTVTGTSGSGSSSLQHAVQLTLAVN